METKTQATLETLNNGSKITPYEISEEASKVKRGGLQITVEPDLQSRVLE